MNVKPGDLARIVGHPDMAHAIVRVVRRLTGDDVPSNGGLMEMPAWSCEALCTIHVVNVFARPGREIWIADRSLRRLGDSGVEDELVRFAAKEQQA